jgi:cytochrome P450
MIDDTVAEKIIHKDNLPKHQPTYEFMYPILGKTGLVTIHGEYWRKLRKMFNPAFSVSHLETMIPGIIEESMVFVKILETAAQAEEVLKFGERVPVCTNIRGR